MGKKPQSGGRGGQRGVALRRPGNQEGSKTAARLNAQKTRLTRAMSRAEALPNDGEGEGSSKKEAILAVHQDAVSTYGEYCSVGRRTEEHPVWVQAERLKHMTAIFEMSPDSQAALGMRAEYLLTLLDEGEAARARKLLDGLSEQEKSDSIFAWSLALLELVAWKGEEEGASEEVCSEKVKIALKANPYIGVFLSNLDCYTREINPLDVPTIQGRTKGSVEEALAYAGVAAGCWIDFDDDGSVAKLVGDQLEEMEVEWPPMSEGKSDKYVKQFLDASEIAEKEAEAESEEEDTAEAEKDGEDAGAKRGEKRRKA